MNNFPRVAVAAIVVSLAVAVVQRIDSRAGWLMAIATVLGMLMFYPGARDNLTELVQLTMGGKA